MIGTLRAAGLPARSLWDHMCDGDDCSVARGIGLAVGNTPFLSALQATTVRPSDRSSEESGDNLVFFGRNGQTIPNLFVEKAYVFPISGSAGGSAGGVLGGAGVARWCSIEGLSPPVAETTSATRVV